MGVDAWYMDDSVEDQRKPHRRVPNEPVSQDVLDKLGVLYWKVDAQNLDSCAIYNKVREERGYNYVDKVTISRDALPEYEAKLKMFYQEHLHEDEEVRLIMSGSGYFDVRDFEERWIRIDCREGDMIVLPAGIYHRFTLDENNFAVALRLFKGEPVWTPFNRPADDRPARQEYIDSFVKAQ